MYLLYLVYNWCIVIAELGDGDSYLNCGISLAQRLFFKAPTGLIYGAVINWTVGIRTNKQ